MSSLNKKLAVVRVTTLAAALMGVYGVAQADPSIDISDGQTSTQIGGSFEYVKVQFKLGDKTQSTTLNASGLTVVDDRGNPNGAVFAKGGEINIASSDITTSGKQGYGLQAYSSQLGEASSTIIATGLTIVTSGEKGSGAYIDVIQNAGERSDTTLSITDSRITTTGLDAKGLLVGGIGDSRAGKSTLTGTNLVIITSGNKSIGVKADNLGHAVVTNAVVTTSGAGAHGAYAGAGGKIDLVDGSLTTAGTTLGTAAYGAYAKGNGSSITTRDVAITAKGSAIDTANGMSMGVLAEDASTITLQGGSVSTLGAFARGVLASSGATVTTDGVAISTAGIDSHAVQANGAAQVDIVGGTIKTQEDRSWGFNINGATVTSSANITTEGKNSFGVFSYGTGGQFTQNGGSITTKGGPGTDGSFGVLAKSGGEAVLIGTMVTTHGDYADGLRSDYDPAKAGGIINATNTIVNTSGSNAHGVSVYGGGGKVTMQGGSIAATGANSSAVYVQDNGSVVLDGVRAESAGAAITSQLNQAGQTQDITIGSGSNLTVNNGTLLQVNRSADGMDGIVNLSLKAGSVSTGSVIDMDGLVAGGSGERTQGGKTNFNLETGAQWAGIIWGVNDASTGDGATFVDEGGAPIAGNVLGGENSIITFKNGATIGGGVQTGTGSTATFNGPTTIGGTVLGNGSNYVFSQSAPTTIGGSVVLNVGSTLKGGTIGTPITIEGDAAVGTGSTLGGNLNVKGALSGSGGTLSPGNSVGTQTYGSSAEFAGAYKAEVNAAGKSDLIVISTGNFDLSPIALTVAQENGNGGYVLNHDYTIIQTPGGQVENTFKSTALDNSFAGTLVKLDPVKYGAKDVKVSLSVDNSAAQAKRAGLSGNQNATLDGVLSVAGKNTAADAALQSTDTAGAMNQLSGEVHASTSSALLAAGGLVQRTVAQRMRGNLGVGMTAGAPTAQAGGAPVAGSMPQSAALPLWAQVVGNWNTLSDDGNAAKVKSNMGGVFIGGDTAVGSGWRVGGALGFTDGQIDVDDRSSRTKARSYTASLYGGNSWATGKGSVNFLAGAAYTRHNLDSRRSITLAGGQKLTADYHANSAQLFTELGYALPVGANSVVEPYAGLAWLSQRMQGFSESGGSAALRSDSQTDTVTTFTLGLRGKTTMELSAGKRVTLFAGLGWRHASGDVTSTRNLAFIQGNGASFQVSGAPIAKNAALVDAGVEASIGRNAALGLSYNGQYGSGNTNHVGSLYVKMRF